MTMINNDPSSFGALLKTFRQCKHLTQQLLAESIGLHRSTVIRWEQGDFLPESKAMVLELAQRLRLNDQETRQLLEASLTALVPPWSVPWPRNLYFTGREKILHLLHTQLGVDQAVARPQSLALCGLGGVGKTQITLEYAYRYALEYRAVFWIAAETAESCLSSLLRIAEVLQLAGREGMNQQRAMAALQHWLSTQSQWLLICDNVEDPGLLQGFLPTVRSGVLLLTTRCQALGTLAQRLDLSPMEPEEGSLFLLRRAKLLALEMRSEDFHQQSTQEHLSFCAATKLVTMLGGLPLAIDQAAAYLEETGGNINDYLSLYEQQPARMLARRGNPEGDHPHSVTVTFGLSLVQIEREQRVPADLLRVCALFHADDIPEEVFVEGAAHLGPTLAPLVSDPALLDAALAVLRRFSLVHRQAETHLLSLHRVVQVVLKASLPEADLRLWMIRALSAVSQLFPANDEAFIDYWHRCERLLPHALVCLSWTNLEKEAAPQRIALLTHVAAYFLRRSRLTEAGSLYQQAYTEAQQVLEPEQLLFAEIHDGLADLHLLHARYEEAELHYQQAFHLRERVLGGEHPQVAASLSGLALLYCRLGKYAEAEASFQRSLTLRQRAFGPDHPQVANSLSQLAFVLRVQGKYDLAESLYQRALHIRERVFERTDPQVTLSFYHLATLYLEQDKYEKAEPFFIHAVRLWEEVLGPEDLDLAFALTGLARVLSEQSRYKEAEALFLRALHIRELVLGSDHPQVAAVQYGLAKLSHKQGKYTQAEQHYQQALYLQEKHLGQRHTETVETLHSLALLRQSQGKRDEALSLAERALKIRCQTLGKAHPRTIATQILSMQLREEKTVEFSEPIVLQVAGAAGDAYRQ